VPTVKCSTTNDNEDLWLGIQAYQNPAGVNADAMFAQVKAGCDFGVVSYTAFAEAGTTTNSMTVKPGDLVDVFIRESSSASVSQVTDLTTGPGISSVGGPLFDLSVLEGQQDLTAVVPTFTDVPTGLDTIFFLDSFVNGFRQRFDGIPTLQLNETNHKKEIGTTSLTLNKSAFKLNFRFNF
jgi:hypothetical protein